MADEVDAEEAAPVEDADAASPVSAETAPDTVAVTGSAPGEMPVEASPQATPATQAAATPAEVPAGARASGPAPGPATAPDVTAPDVTGADVTAPDVTGTDVITAGLEALSDRLAALEAAVTALPPPALTDALTSMADRLARVEAAVTAPPSPDPLADAVAGLDRRLNEVARLGERHNELIDKLHQENQQLRKGELAQAQAPLFRDLVRLADQLVQLDEASPDPGKSDAAIAASQVREILARAGVRPVGAVVGDDFDAALHQGLGRRETTEADLDGTLAYVRRDGFMGPDGKLLRPAEVEVYRFEPPVPVAVPPPTAPEAVPAQPEAATPARPEAVTPDPVASDPAAADVAPAASPAAAEDAPRAAPTSTDAPVASGVTPEPGSDGPETEGAS